MDNLSSCTTPASLRPVSPNIFDQLQIDEDDNFDLSLVASPGSKRCPTFKEYAEKIKRLQQENFQLRVRIYLSEQKTGVKTSSSDLAVLYTQLHSYHNAGGNGSNVALAPQISHSTVQSCSSATSALPFETASTELDKIKLDKSKLEEILTAKDQQISELSAKNDELTQKYAEMGTEIQKLNERLASGNRNSDDEVEKLACFAFGQSDDIELLNAEWEAKLADKTNVIAQLETELQRANMKIEVADKKIGALKTDVKMYESKVKEMSEALKETGRRCVRAERNNEKILKRVTDGLADQIGGLAISPNPDKFATIQQLVEMLQSRMRELTNFVETLLQLESKKVFTLTGLTDENRENLLKSIEQCRLFSKNLNKLFEQNANGQYSSGDNLYHSRDSHGYSHGHHRHRHHSSSTESQYRNAFSPLERVRLKTSEVQCNIFDSTLANSVESANAYINKLKNDISTLESINGQLGQEKADLRSQVKSLESNIKVLRMTNHPDKPGMTAEGLKVNDENKKLQKRLAVTEEALRHLHTQHAKLVSELKTLRSTYQKSSKVSVGVGNTVVESTRPSDSTSPDLGIDSGHDGALNSDDSNATNFKEENRILRTTNRELAIKLKQTRQALDNTLEKLNSTTKEKEQVEKAICRQLHKTHTILRQAKKSVEKFTNSQCQENINPSSP